MTKRNKTKRQDDKHEARVGITATVHGKDSLFLRQDCGTAEGDDGQKWSLSFGIGTGSPIVELPDGRWITFSWQALVEAANEAGAQP